MVRSPSRTRRPKQRHSSHRFSKRRRHRSRSNEKEIEFRGIFSKEKQIPPRLEKLAIEACVHFVTDFQNRFPYVESVLETGIDVLDQISFVERDGILRLKDGGEIGTESTRVQFLHPDVWVTDVLVSKENENVILKYFKTWKSPYRTKVKSKLRVTNLNQDKKDIPPEIEEDVKARFVHKKPFNVACNKVTVHIDLEKEQAHLTVQQGIYYAKRNVTFSSLVPQRLPPLQTIRG